MSYFRTSYATLQALARECRYEDVSAFLVIARHASGISHAGFDPYKLSGAGVNSIHEKAGLSEENARGAMERLRQAGVIAPVTSETKKVFFHARWEIFQGDLDLDLPHAFVDSSKDGKMESAMRRIKRHDAVSASDSELLENVSDTELRLDALMLLVAVYQGTSMQNFGGVSPQKIWRPWEIKSKTPAEHGVRWGAEPDHKRTSVTNTRFMTSSLAHALEGKGKASKVDVVFKARFWNAWKILCETGLVYEAVSLYDADPSTNTEARLKYTLRINDYHAGSIKKSGDPSLLRALEADYGSEFAFYTPSENDRDEPEAMWVILPDDRGALVGVWRPRFRAKTKDVGTWIESEEVAINGAVEIISGTGNSV